MKIVFFLLLLSCSFFHSEVWCYEFAPDEYEEIKKIALKILEKCPPDKCYYLGIGRSPTPLLAFFRSIGIQDVSSVPLSSFDYAPPLNHLNSESFNKHYPKNLGPLNASQEEKLYKHFERFLPEEKILRGKKLLLIDYSLYGGSLFSTHIYLEKFYQQKGIPANIQIQSYMAHNKEDFITKAGKSLGHAEKPIIITPESRFLFFMNNQHYDQYAQYGRYIITAPDSTNAHQLKPNSAHEEFVKAMKEKIKKDPTLQLELEAINVGYCP